jgi:hypothetical protein
MSVRHQTMEQYRLLVYRLMARLHEPSQEQQAQGSRYRLLVYAADWLFRAEKEAISLQKRPMNESHYEEVS